MPPAGTQSPHPAPCQGWLHAEPPVPVLARARRLYLGAVSVLPAVTSAIHRRGARARPEGTGGSERAEPKALARRSLRILPCVLGGPHRPEASQDPCPASGHCPDPRGSSGRWSSRAVFECPAQFLALQCCSAAPSPVWKLIPPRTPRRARVPGIPESVWKHEGEGIEAVVGESEWTPPGQPQFPQTLSREGCSHPW